MNTVKRILGVAKNGPEIKLIISSEKLEKRVALLEDSYLEEYSIERDSERNIVSGIFKGKVRNIEHGLKAMFVDIGFEKNAFLHFWDAMPAALDHSVEAVQRGGHRAAPKKKISAKDIPSIYPVGSEVIVQVTKGPIGNKGPRVTSNISMAGRYMVLMPFNDQCGVSRKIEDPKERARLRKILTELSLPEGMGVIIRTAGEGQRARFFVRDLNILLDQWNQIETAMKEKPAASTLMLEPDLIARTVRDLLTENITAVYIDDLKEAERMKDLVEPISKRARKLIHHYNGPKPIFDHFGVQQQIDHAFLRQVWLPCGGYIVIDETEAMITVDVNTGRNKGNKDMEKTLLQTNLEAADEIARQLRLRNIGGLIVADFIDMKSRKDQQAVYQRMRDRLKRDKARTHILPISSLGLMEMTRQRAQESLASSHYTHCTYCSGKGVIKSVMTMSVELQRLLHTLMKRHQDEVHEFKVTVHPELLQRLRNEDDELLADIQRRYAATLSFRSDPTLHVEKFIIQNALTNQELVG
ncbi:MAG: ribonuclease [Verrucomicrobia bacterium RIFCSPHIGHO2_12_FULL_41_10]|nr:MAG: ribonuclease [Verrucomicrobia bacterium RIFCSPHIGHO2_12_FULL_41_10]